MDNDISALLFEAARRAQARATRLRRRRLARQRKQETRDDTAIGMAAKGAGREHGTGLECGDLDPDGGTNDGRYLSPTQKLGQDYEDQALVLLMRAGLRPLARNLRCRSGEIDLALRDGDTLVLVEVRARGDGRFGGAAASVDRAKQARLVRAAGCLLPRLAGRHWSGRAPPVRFDVVAFEGGKPLWLRHAFDAP